MRIHLLRVPSSAGAYGVGQECAPAALDDVGLVEALRAAGVAVADAGSLPVERFRPDPANRRQQNLLRVVDVASAVAARIAEIADASGVPLVIGGDCTITIGVIAGLVPRWPDLGLAYVDGDADLDTPATTRSGILDAMGIAHLLGVDGAAPTLARLGPRAPLLVGSRVALIGYDDAELDEHKRTMLHAHGVHCLPASRVRGRPVQAAADALDTLGADAPVVVHFDVDAIDSIDCPLAHFPHFNTGLTFDDALAVFGRLCAADQVAAITVTEINPDHDPDHKQLRRLVDGLAAAISQATTSRQHDEGP